MLQNICAEIEAKRNDPQALWTRLRDFAVANCVRCQTEMLRDVEDFCFAVLIALSRMCRRMCANSG